MPPNPPDDFEQLCRAALALAGRYWRSPLVRVDVHLNDGRVLSFPLPDRLEAEAPPSPAATADALGPGNRSIRWGGTLYPLTPKQGLVVVALLRARERGTPDVPGSDLLRAAESECVRLVDLFRGSSAWGALVIQGDTQGTYRLADPQPSARPKGAPHDPN